MFALITIIGMDTQIELFDTVLAVEEQLKIRYNKELREAKEIDWRNTWFDERKGVCRIDSWSRVTEIRGCEVA